MNLPEKPSMVVPQISSYMTTNKKVIIVYYKCKTKRANAHSTHIQNVLFSLQWPKIIPSSYNIMQSVLCLHKVSTRLA